VTRPDLVALLPLLVLGAGALATTVVASLRRRSTPTALAAATTLVASLAALAPAARVVPRAVTPLLEVDGVALLFLVIILSSALAVLLLALRYLERRREPPEAFHVLLLLATAGAAVLACSRHFAALFLGIETLSVSLYGLVGYFRTERRSLEAGLKYLVLAGASSAFLLFGVALVYAGTGSLGFDALGGPGVASPLVVPGLGLVLVGIAFKLALVPFHMWTPDVYEGAPAPVTALVASVSKGAVVAVLLRLWLALDPSLLAPVTPMLVLLAVASMLGGNLLALRQTDLKRLLAGSSIAHLGYLIVALLAWGTLAVEAVSFYVVAYAVSILSALGVVSVLSGSGEEAGALDAYRGLFWRRPWLAAALTASLLSLAGIPLTVGFIGKFYVVSVGVLDARWLAIGALVVGSVLGLYYYLRVVVTMVQAPPDESGESVPASLAASLALVVLVGLLVGLGIAPTPLQDAIRLALSGVS